MCGIVGGIGVDPAVFDAMVDSLAHRGPDGRGVWSSERVFLGHRRLAILDPDPRSAQPMSRGHAVLTYNGEIYNFRELRRELESRGRQFSTSGDTEVLLEAYREWGPACIRRLNGMFAFAIWDGQRRRLWLARDRMGIKPLYYSHSGGVFRFASEPKAILADRGFPREPCGTALQSYLTFGYTAAPETAYRAMQELPPGHSLYWEDGELRREAYWTLTDCGGGRSDPREFPEIFAAAVRRHLVSDVPLGALLSGGLDSAAVVAAAGPLPSFCLGFDEPSFDERPLVAETARRLECPFFSEVCGDWMSTLDALPLDEPFSDSSMLAVEPLCRLARGHVRVVLSGDGADELLGGYSTYTATYLAGVYRWLPQLVRGVFSRLVFLLPVSERRYPIRQLLERFVSGAELGPYLDFASWRAHLFPADRGIYRWDWEGEPLAEYAGRAASGGMLQADLSYYLPSDMLRKVDRASMLHGLEVRLPFLDNEVVEYCRSLPARALWRKSVLRRSLPGWLAQRKKRGFNVPIERLMRGAMGDRLEDLLSGSRFARSGPLDPAGVRALLAAHRTGRRDCGHLLFTVLVLALWWERWL